MREASGSEFEMFKNAIQLGTLVAMLSSAVAANAAPVPTKPPARKCGKKNGIYACPYATSPLAPPPRPMTKEEKRRSDVEQRLKYLEQKVLRAEGREIERIERKAALVEARTRRLKNKPILESLELELGVIPATNRGGLGGLTAVAFTFGSLDEIFTLGLRLSARILTDKMKIYDPTEHDIAGKVPAYYTDMVSTMFVTTCLTKYLFWDVEWGFGFRWVHVPKEAAMIFHGSFQEPLPRKAFNEVYGVFKFSTALGFKLGKTTMKVRYAFDFALADPTRSLQPSGNAWLQENRMVWTHVLSIEFSHEWQWLHPSGK